MPTLNDIKVQAYELLESQAQERTALKATHAQALADLEATHRAALLAKAQEAINLGLTYEEIPLAFRILLGGELLELFE